MYNLSPVSKESSAKRVANVGLIGVGTRLRLVVRKLLQAATDGELKIVSAFDPDEKAHRKLREVLDYDYLKVESEAAVWNNPAVDWVLIGSWNNLHASQVTRSLEAGKNVFCEKPLAITKEDCLAIRDAVMESGRIFAFGLVLRYSEHYRKIREILATGRIGNIVSMEFNETLSFNHGGHIYGNWRKASKVSGGHMLEKCSHDLDLANWFADSVPMRVASFGGKNFFTPENAHRIDEIGPNDKGVAAYKGWTTFCNDPDHPFLSGGDVLDNQVVILEYANGIRATFHANSNAGIPERRFYILGTKGAIRADLLTSTIEVGDIGWEERIEKWDMKATDGHGGGDDIMAQSLVRTMTNGEPPLASIGEGICSAITALAIDTACFERRVVDLAAVWDEVGINAENRLMATGRRSASALPLPGMKTEAITFAETSKAQPPLGGT